jgi:hypothetical protein
VRFMIDYLRLLFVNELNVGTDESFDERWNWK